MTCALWGTQLARFAREADGWARAVKVAKLDIFPPRQPPSGVSTFTAPGTHGALPLFFVDSWLFVVQAANRSWCWARNNRP